MSATDETRRLKEQQAAAAAQRYRDASAQRVVIEEQLAAGVRYPDSPQAIARRAARLLDQGGVPAAAVVESIHARALEGPETLERIVGLTMDLQPWSFLPRGVRAGASVARISILRDGLEQPHATGFLVSPRLLLTNHHVFPDAATVRVCFVEFNAQVTVDNGSDVPVRYELDADAFFTADEHLDYALVALRSAADGRLAGEVFGWNQLVIEQGKIVVNDPVNVIGHPMGRLKEIAIRDNALVQRLEDFLHYRTDTEPGNSGSPVYNDQWEVVALHHQGVPNTDDQGRILRKDGQPWRRGIDGDDTVDYVSNEGARISSVLKHLAAQPWPAAQRALLAEMGPASGLQEDAAAGPVTGPLVPAGPVREAAADTTPRLAGDRATARVSTPARTGLKASQAASGGRRHLVFLHGRSQHGKNPVALRRAWAGGLNHGLTKAGRATVVPEDIWFPFYGDRIAEVLGQREALTLTSVDVSAAAAARVYAAESVNGTYEQLVLEAAALAGMPLNGRPADENFGGTLVGSLHGALDWLAAKTGVDALTIAAVFGDVDAYLRDEAIRTAVLECVAQTLPSEGELVLVTHSLGTVVGMDLVAGRLPEATALALLVTAGSPLGMDAVYSRLLAQGPRRPAAVTNWVNAWCPTDAVAIGCPLERRWGKLTQEHAVVNASERAHSIEEYLAHPEVARAIDEFLRPPAQ